MGKTPAPRFEDPLGATTAEEKALQFSCAPVPSMCTGQAHSVCTVGRAFLTVATVGWQIS